MDTSAHNLTTLFAQLGLDNTAKQIDAFVEQHTLPSGMKIADAPFWNEGQRHFIAESLNEDGDWSETIDVLDTLLRE